MRSSKVLSWLINDVTCVRFAVLTMIVHFTAEKGQADGECDDGFYVVEDENSFDDNDDKRID